jgi:hypothetical protein
MGTLMRPGSSVVPERLEHIARVDAKFLTATSRRSWIGIALFDGITGAAVGTSIAPPTSHAFVVPRTTATQS